MKAHYSFPKILRAANGVKCNVIELICIKSEFRVKKNLLDSNFHSSVLNFAQLFIEFKKEDCT